MPVIDVPEKIRHIMDIMEKEGFEARAVGGCVRDSLLGRPIHDWDLCTSAQPDETERVFSRAGFHTIPTGKKHGTITVLWEKEPVEITTYRIDGAYTDSRRPDSVTFTRALEDDLSRRDFTVNAMACGQDGKVIDLFGGQDDLERGLIRCVGAPQMRFEEDALRILRALRFGARLGFRLEEETAKAVLEERERLALISPERIWAELQGLFLGKEISPLVKRFYPVLVSALGLEDEGREPNWLEAARSLACPLPEGWTEWMIMTARFALMLWKGAYSESRDREKQARDCCISLRTDRDSRTRISLLAGLADAAVPTTVPEIRRLTGSYGAETVRQLIFIWEAGRNLPGEQILWLREQAEEIIRRGDCVTIGQLAVSGGDLQELGISPGPQVGKVLHSLLEAVMDDLVPNEKGALEEMVLRSIKV